MTITQRRPPSNSSTLPNDLTIGHSGLAMIAGPDGKPTDEMDYLWFEVSEREAGETYTGYKVVKLLMLRYLPQEAKKDAGLVAKTRSALVGLYNAQARFDLVQVVAGMFDPPIGIVQCYGVMAFEETKAAALHQADLGLAALKGVLSNYTQSRFVPLNGQKAAWLIRAMRDMPQALVAIGHPDPRQNARGGGRDTPEEQPDMAGQGAYTMQQNELLFRGMATLQAEFVFLLLAHRIEMRSITQMLAGISGEASVWASRTTGAKGLSFGLSVPIMLSGGLARQAGTSYSENAGRSAGQSIGDSVTNTHTVGDAATVGHAESHSTSHEVGNSHTSGTTVSVSTGTNTGQAHNTGTSESWGTSQSHTSGVANSNSQTNSVSTSVSDASGWNTNQGVNTSHSVGGGVAHGTGSSVGTGSSTGTAQSTQQSHADQRAEAITDGGSYTIGKSATAGAAMIASASATQSEAATHSAARSNSTGASDTVGSGQTVSQGNSTNAGRSTTDTHSANWGSSAGSSVGSGQSGSHAVTSVASSSSSSSTTVSESDTIGSSHERGVSAGDTVSRGQSDGRTVSNSASDTSSESFGESWGETNSWSRTHSVSDAVAQGQTRGLSVSETFATGLGHSLGAASSLGVSGGIVPSLSVSKSYNWVDAQAQQVAELLRVQEGLLVQASTDGAYLTDVYMLMRTAEARTAAEALVRQAFHGSERVVTAFQTRRLDALEQLYIRDHAFAFTPSTRIETVPGLLEGYKDSTLLPPEKLAALYAPGLFERGPAVTTEERIPPFTFLPDLKGDAVLGRLWDFETATLTRAELRLSEDKHMHTAFVGDTGFGKTVAAERLCVEAVNRWHHRAVVLDWGQGWRKLLDGPIDRNRVDVYQLHARAVRPLRWNPLQIGQRIDPDTQWRATVELFANAGGLGQKQGSYLLNALRAVYLDQGVFTADPEVQLHVQWGQVTNAAEAALVGAALNTPLVNLTPDQLQALAVQRSKGVDLGDWVAALKATLGAMPQGDANRSSLEGAVVRMERLTQGVIGRRYAKGPGSIAIEDLGLLGSVGDQWGVAVLEGGAELDRFSKTVLLGLIAWHLYTDAVARRRESIGRKLPALNIFFEEANKIFAGEATRSGSGDSGPAQDVCDQFIPMFTDGRKYRVYCHPILQAVNLLPQVILSSCVNIFVGQTKGPKDRDATLAHLAKSEKGFTDEEYKRFVSRLPPRMLIAKLGYGQELWEMGPMLCEANLVPASEPTDEYIRHWYSWQPPKPPQLSP